MTRVPYFAFYPADFMNGVRGLTAQEVGVYTMLLCRIYEESGPVEYHPRRLATYCVMREATFVSVVEKLVDLDKIQVADGRISNRRAECEISKRADGLKIASKAGKSSAEKRQQKQRQDATPVERPLNHTDTDTDTEEREDKTSCEVLVNFPKMEEMVGEECSASSHVSERYNSKASGSDACRRALCEVLSEETADAFIAHRKASKSSLTEHAARLIAKKLRGHPKPDAVVEQSIMNGWKGVFPDATPVPFKPDFSKYGEVK